MQLLKLPDVVQSDVLKQLHPSELFILALCSRRSLFALKRNLRLPKPEIWVENVLNPEKLQKMGPYKRGECPWHEISIYLKTGRNQIQIIKIEKATLRENRITFDERMFGFPSQIDWDKTGNLCIYHVTFLISFNSKFMKIHKLLCEMFKAPSEVYLVLQTPQWDFLPKNSVSRCDFTKMIYINIKNANNFWRVHPNQLCIVDATQSCPFSTSDYEHFKNINNILVKRSENNAIVLFLSFEGKHLVLENGIIPLFYLKTFLEKWMNKEGGNLKSVIIKRHQTCSIDKITLLEGIKTEKCENGTFYNYDSVVKEFHTFPIGAFDCTDGLDIIRGTDGRRATIKITKDYFMFLVW